MGKKNRIPHKYLPWIDARKKFRLSHAHVQMARELGLNPKKLGGINNSKTEIRKSPLQDYIERLYEERFGRTEPTEIRTLEQMAAEHLAIRAAKKEAKLAAEMKAGVSPEEMVQDAADDDEQDTI
jgi:hypothetical protein